MTHSDSAVDLAGDITTSIVYPLLADLVATAGRYCAWQNFPLNDEQTEQLTRASIEVCDGVLDKISAAVDARRAFGLLNTLEADDA